MKSILALIICLLCCELRGQVLFTNSQSPGVGANPFSVCAADINGDGWVDLITADISSGTITVLTNNHAGRFVLAATYSATMAPCSITAADVNGDGRMDLIFANSGSGAGTTVTVLTNNANIGFVFAGNFQVGTDPNCVTAADINGDGKMDLITANFGASSVSVLTNNGSGGFIAAGTNYAVGNNPFAVIAADLNGDGRLDLICANYGDNTLTVLTNSGSGRFVVSGTYPVGAGPLSIKAIDVNNDGKLDIVSANANNNTVSVLTNNGIGGLVLAHTYSVGSSPRSLVTADVNGDGRLDIITGNSGGSSITVLTNDGVGGFVLAGTFAVGNSPFSIAAADVNGDGKPDLITANYGDNTLSVLTNASTFPPQSPPVITTQPVGQTNAVGATASFSVAAISVPGLQAQWRINGTNLSGATNLTLTLTNLALGQGGNYDVVLTNSFGSVTSSPAILDVVWVLTRVNGQPAVGSASAVASAQITLSGGYPGGFLFYTLDGSTPTTGSSLYGSPFILTNSALLQILSLSADFTQSNFPPALALQIIPTYALQTSVSGSGTVSANPPGGPYPSNSIVTLTAAGAQYWGFDHWSGDGAGNQNPLSVTMNGPRNVQAVFIQTSYPLSVGSPGGGSVTVNGQPISNNTYFASGGTVTLAANPSNGWVFLGWQGNASGTNNPLNLTISQTNSIQAVFGTMVGTNATGGGNIVLNQANPIPFGTSLTASAVPDAGNYLVTWSGAATGTNAPTKILVTNATPGINALFAALPTGKFSLAVVVNGNGSVTINPQRSYYNPADSVTLSASTTNAGVRFYGWTGDASGTNSPILVVMNTNLIVQANFSGLPTVSISPQNLVVFGGSNALLTASASGLPPLTYQWQNGLGAIPGATNSTFAIVNAQATDSDNYSVVVSNPFGSVTSTVAAVTVVFPPTISVQPFPQTVGSVGANLQLSVTAGGTSPLSYQWQSSAGPVFGATNSTLVFNPAQTNNSGNYVVVISNAYGAITSQMANVFVYAPVVIQIPPISQVVPAFASATFQVVASGFPTPYLYQWMLNGTNLTGATNSAFTITNVSPSDTGSYQVQVGNGFSTANSIVATLNMAPSIISPFAGATTIWGRSATLSVGVEGSGQLNYQWYDNGIAIAGATNSTLNFPSIQFTNGGLYSVVVSSLFGSVSNVAAQVVVNPAGLSLGFSPTLTITGVVGYTYVIQSTTNLTDTNSWLTLTNLTLTQPVQIWVDTNVDASSPFNPKTFYRLLPGQ